MLGVLASLHFSSTYQQRLQHIITSRSHMHNPVFQANLHVIPRATAKIADKYKGLLLVR